LLLESNDDDTARGALLADVKTAEPEAVERSETASEEVTGMVITVVDAI
jgi:hypothetical protein